MKIAAQKRVDALRTMPHFVIGRTGRIVPLVMLPGTRQFRELVMDRRTGRPVLRRIVRGVEGQGRRAGERRAHQRDRAEYIRPYERAPGRNGSAKIVAKDPRDLAIAE